MEEDIKKQEEQYGMKLQQDRFRSRQASANVRSAPSGPRINIVEAPFVIGFAIVMDFLSSIPWLGVLFDIIAGVSIWFWVKMRGLDRGSPWLSWTPGIATLLEIVLNLIFPPAAAIFTSFTISVLIIIVKNSQTGRRLSKLASPI